MAEHPNHTEDTLRRYVLLCPAVIAVVAVAGCSSGSKPAAVAQAQDQASTIQSVVASEVQKASSVAAQQAPKAGSPQKLPVSDGDYKLTSVTVSKIYNSSEAKAVIVYTGHGPKTQDICTFDIKLYQNGKQVIDLAGIGTANTNQTADLLGDAYVPGAYTYTFEAASSDG